MTEADIHRTTVNKRWHQLVWKGSTSYCNQSAHKKHFYSLLQPEIKDRQDSRPKHHTEYTCEATWLSVSFMNTD